MAPGSYDMTGSDADEAADARGAAARAGRAVGPGSRYRREMARSNLFLVGLFVAGVMAVYGLSLHRGPAQASAEQKLTEAQVDSAILRFAQDPGAPAPPAPGRISRELLQNSYDQISRRQVPLKGLRRNPFVFVPPPADTPTVFSARSDEASSQPVAPVRRENQEEMLAAFRRLHLQSVMMGRNGGIAMISNNLLTVGQSIDGFVVKSIGPNSVMLSWQNTDLELKMP